MAIKYLLIIKIISLDFKLQGELTSIINYKLFIVNFILFLIADFLLINNNVKKLMNVFQSINLLTGHSTAENY